MLEDYSQERLIWKPSPECRDNKYCPLNSFMTEYVALLSTTKDDRLGNMMVAVIVQDVGSLLKRLVWKSPTLAPSRWQVFKPGGYNCMISYSTGHFNLLRY